MKFENNCHIYDVTNIIGNLGTKEFSINIRNKEEAVEAVKKQVICLNMGKRKNIIKLLNNRPRCI